MTNFQEYLDEKLKDPEFRAEYDALEPHYDIINALIKSGLSEDAIVEKTGFAKNYVRRIEYANANPSIATLQRLAVAMDTKLRIVFEPITRSEQTMTGRE